MKKKESPTCDRKAMREFDYSSLDPAFHKLSRPAQRALIRNGILKPKDLAKFSFAQILEFHGVGPSTLPVLKRIKRSY